MCSIPEIVCPDVVSSDSHEARVEGRGVHAVVEYKCRDGFTYYSGNYTSECSLAGTWSNSTLVCTGEPLTQQFTEQVICKIVQWECIIKYNYDHERDSYPFVIVIVMPDQLQLLTVFMYIYENSHTSVIYT